MILALRALREPSLTAAADTATMPTAPYRIYVSDRSPPPRHSHAVSFVRANRQAMLRLVSGSLFALYLSVWTIGWSGGALPQHRIWLDLLLTAALGLVFWKTRSRVPFVPLVASYSTPRATRRETRQSGDGAQSLRAIRRRQEHVS
jgi:hypothetical protein